MPAVIHCHQCGECEAEHVGGDGTPKKPWEWECMACGVQFECNDYAPNDGDEAEE